MPQITGEIGLNTADLPDHSTLVRAFDRFTIEIWRVLLRLSAQLHEPSGHAAIDSTFFEHITRSIWSTLHDDISSTYPIQ